MDDKKIKIEVALTGQEAEALCDFCDHITFNIYPELTGNDTKARRVRKALAKIVNTFSD
ncbi:MAG: hypothetical protein KJ737_20390 [Proteobacteria bacterium]|nr:hypothetical protein [Pseudomonadota bacterium]